MSGVPGTLSAVMMRRSGPALIRDQRQTHQALVGGGRSRLHDVQIGILNLSLDADTRFTIGESRDANRGHGCSDQAGDFFRKPRMGIASNKRELRFASYAVFVIHTNRTLTESVIFMGSSKMGLQAIPLDPGQAPAID